MRANNRNFHNRIVRGINLAQVWKYLEDQDQEPLKFYAYNNGQRVEALTMHEAQGSDDGSTKQMMQITAARINSNAVQLAYASASRWPEHKAIFHADTKIEDSTLNRVGMHIKVYEASELAELNNALHQYIEYKKWRATPCVTWLLAESS